MTYNVHSAADVLAAGQHVPVPACHPSSNGNQTTSFVVPIAFAEGTDSGWTTELTTAANRHQSFPGWRWPRPEGPQQQTARYAACPPCDEARSPTNWATRPALGPAERKACPTPNHANAPNSPKPLACPLTDYRMDSEHGDHHPANG